MADIEESIKPLEQKSNKLIEAFHERGIIKDIEKLQDHETKELSKRAVSFMKWVSELPSQIENSEWWWDLFICKYIITCSNARIAEKNKLAYKIKA